MSLELYCRQCVQDTIDQAVNILDDKEAFDKLLTRMEALTLAFAPYGSHPETVLKMYRNILKHRLTGMVLRIHIEKPD